MKLDTKSRRLDLGIVLSLVLFAVLYNLLVEGTFFGKAMIGLAAFTVPSTIYLGLRSKKPWKKIAIATLVFGGIFGFLFEFIQELNQAYSVVSTILPSFLFLPIDNILGHMLMALLTFTFYEHFVVQRDTPIRSRRLKYIVILGVAVDLLLVLLYFINSSLITFPYSYAILGTVAIIPVFIYALRHPKEIGTLTSIAPIFFVIYLLVELFAVKNGWWVYPSPHYIGSVSIWGLSFPFEELFFWMLFYAAALVVYYRVFVSSPK